MYEEKKIGHFQNIICFEEKIQRVITVGMAVSEVVLQMHLYNNPLDLSVECQIVIIKILYFYYVCFLSAILQILTSQTNQST